MGARRGRPRQILLDVGGLTDELRACFMEGKGLLPLLSNNGLQHGPLRLYGARFLLCIRNLSQFILTDVVKAFEPIAIFINRVVTRIDSFRAFAHGDVSLTHANLALDSGLPVEVKYWDRFLIKLDVALSSHFSFLALLSLEFLVELLPGTIIDFRDAIRVSIYIMRTICCVVSQDLLTLLLHGFLSQRENRSTSFLTDVRGVGRASRHGGGIVLLQVFE